LTDVTAPLLGPTGAAAVFAPQKGATPADVVILEDRLATWAARFGDVDPMTAGAGAAGGTAFGLLTWGGEIESGSAAIAALTNLPRHLEAADVFITGEGSFDDTSYTGKVVGHALELAEAAAVARTIAIVGRLATEPHLPDGRPVASISLSVLAGSPEAALADPTRWSIAAGREAATQLEA
jgi:glycerate kinase